MTDFNGIWLVIGLLIGVTSGVFLMVGLFALGDGFAMRRRVCSCNGLPPHFHHEERKWFG